MESFLSASKYALAELQRFEKIRIVLGNCTCDLDSAVSALVQGYSEHLTATKKHETHLVVIPLLNILKKEYRIKTEVVYFLNRHNIPSSLLTFRDDIDLKALTKNGYTRLEIVLVDHHSLPEEDAFLTDYVVKVIDHRPRDKNWPWPGRDVQIEIVGSCATLVARDFLAVHRPYVDSLLASLLRGPILLDTYNLSKEVNRATKTDIQTLEELEQVGYMSVYQRNMEFDDLVIAKTDTSKLTFDDLLIRDLKFVGNVPLVVLPTLARNFLEPKGVFKALKDFADAKGSTIVVLLGILITGPCVQRDLAVYYLSGDVVAEKVVLALLTSREPPLDLGIIVSVQDWTHPNWTSTLYFQGNISATRKHILPIVQEAIMS